MKRDRIELVRHVTEYVRSYGNRILHLLVRGGAITTPLALCLLILSSCASMQAQSNNNGQQATILLRNGGKYTGSVLASSQTQLTLAGDDNVRRTLNMRDVKSIEYNEASNYRPGDTRPSVRQNDIQSNQIHENHYHPQSSAINTRSYELRAGTQISVRSEETIDSGRAVEGQGFAAEVTRDVLDANGAVVIPRGSNAQIIIRSAAKEAASQAPPT